MALRVLRARGALGAASVVAVLLAWIGFLYGARLHFRLRFLPVVEALAVPPRELLYVGHHVPLGLLCALGLATLWCVISRTPWRAVGDALAALAAAMMPIGRLGCVLEGCCKGTACPSWLWYCSASPPGSPAYARQVAGGLIAADAPSSLPLHPLPAYFAVASLVLLGVLLLLLRRRARPGALLAVYGTVNPLVCLWLESFRLHGSERSPELMTGVLVVSLVLGTGIAFAVWGRDGARAIRRASAVAWAGPAPGRPPRVER